MPINHGIHRKLPKARGLQLTVAEMPTCRYGIRRIFAALNSDQFSPTSEERHRAANLERHFYTVFGRFIFSLQNLNRLMHQFAAGFSDDVPPEIAIMGLKYQSECLADHVMSYLNTLLDDVAMMTVQAVGFNKTCIDSMNKLRSNRKSREFYPVEILLDELDSPESWWELGFKRKQGVRQQLVHNQHLVEFQVSKAPDMPYKAQAFLMAPYWGHTGPAIDFFVVLRNILSDLFEWFDRLETALTDYLCQKSPSWSPTLICPAIILPIGYTPGETHYDADYFPIPLCTGSDSLPWMVSVGTGPSGIIIDARK